MTRVPEEAFPSSVQEPLARPARKSLLLRILAALLLAAVLAAAWKWTPLGNVLDLERLAATLQPHRRAWYNLPLVILFFVVLQFLMVPILIPILATGVAFGPWLGSLYALIGTLGSASVGFAIGRGIGPERVERRIGPKMRRMVAKVKGRGLLAVFLILKTPLPSMIVSIAFGAFGARYGDFLLGLVLLRAPLILALDLFEGSLMRVLKHPTPGNVSVAALFFIIPLILVLRIEAALKKSRAAKAVPRPPGATI